MRFCLPEPCIARELACTDAVASAVDLDSRQVPGYFRIARPIMKTCPALFSRILLPAFLVLAGSAASQAAEPLVSFTESRGCRIVGSPSSIARLKEIAAEGTVTWDGKCINGLIDGPGALRHQGVVRENERNRRYAFYLTGSAIAGKRQGTWLRETFNMFEDSAKYWTSLATISYVDGVSMGSPKLLVVRSDADFTPAFRQLLADTDRQISAAPVRPGPPAASRSDTASTGPPLPAAGPAPLPSAPPASLSPPATVAPPVALSNPSAGTPQTPVPTRESPTSSAGSTAPTTSKPLVSAPVAGTGAPAPSQSQKPVVASAAPRASARGGDSAQVPGTASGFQGRGLQPLGETGLRLGPGATATVQPQKILEQTGACHIDEINDAIVGADPIVASSADPLRISGWAADPRGPRIPEQAWVRLFDRGGGPGMLIAMQRNVERPDVARAMGDPAYAKTGFRLALAAGQLAPGEYTVAIVQQLGSELAVCTAVGRLSLR